MLNQLPILLIITPLFFAFLSFVLSRKVSWILALLAIIITTIISSTLFYKVINSSEPIYYHLGNWPSHVGIQYKVYPLNSFFILLISIISLFNIFSMKDLVTKEIDSQKSSTFFGILLVAITGLLGICISNDIFNIYVMLEINAIASYALVGSGQRLESAKAGFDYLIFGTIGSTFILFGIGFIYALTGSLNLDLISNTMPEFLVNNAAKAGIFLMIFGILMKSALFPFGNFLVKIYQGAPSFISSILASISNKVAIYLLISFYLVVFKLHKYSFEYLDIILLAFAIIAIFFCAIYAYKQTNVKRFLAYSSLSQIGFIVFALAISTKTSLSGLLIYCFSHALEKTALFLSVGYLIICLASEDISNFAGIRKKYPWISILIIINLLSNIGMPMTAGFVGKWLLLKSSLAADLWYIFIILVATLFSFSYVFKFIDLILFQSDKNETIVVNAFKSKICLIGITLITALNIYIGINHEFLLNITNQISSIILK